MLGVAEGARQLSAVEMNDLNSGAVEMDYVRKKLAPDFLATFQSILDVMSIQEMKQRAKQLRQAHSIPVSSGTSSTSTKRTAEDSVAANPLKRTRADGPSPSQISEPRTPDQPTHPSNSNWTGGTEESKDEENTKALLKEILTDSMNVLEIDFKKLRWQRSGYRVFLFHT